MSSRLARTADEMAAGGGAAAARRELARRWRAPRGGGQGHVPPRGARGGGRAPLRGRDAASPSTSATPASCWTRSPPRPWRRSRESAITSTWPRSSPAKRCSTSARARAPMSSARPCWSASRAASSGWTSPTSSSRRRRGFGTRRVLAGRVRRGPHRGAAVRRRELRRGHLQRRHQPLAAQGPGLRRGGAGPAAGRAAGDRRHRQRPRAQGAHAAQRRAMGRLHRRRDPPQQLPGGRRGARPGGEGGAEQRLPLHLRAGARRLQHLRGREHLAGRRKAALTTQLRAAGLRFEHRVVVSNSGRPDSNAGSRPQHTQRRRATRLRHAPAARV